MNAFTLATLCLVGLLLAGALFGGIWVWAALFYVTVFAYAIDRLSPAHLGNPDPDAEFPASDGLLVALGIAHFAVLVIVILALTSPALTLVQKIALFFATALFAGQVGHPNAHELIHRPNRMLRRLGTAVYTSLFIGHHASAHPLVHHVHVGTDADPVSAPRGRGFWRYLLRAWPGSFRSGLIAENRRYAGGNLLRHPYMHYTLGGIACIAVAYLLAGPLGVILWIGLGSYAQLQIFLSDYVQHYGLRRAPDANGKPEPVGAQHSWNSPHSFSSAMMLNAPRHSDHHTHPTRKYPALQLDAQAMPILPYSLPMMAAIALIPPLWRRVMDPQLAKWTPAQEGPHPGKTS